MGQAPKRVAIVGDGPAATALGTFLARRGVAVGLFSRGERQAPLVGESMVPALVPILRELGVEDEVRSYAVLKPGATFTVDAEEKLIIDFAQTEGRAPDYAYNAPRDLFDATLLDTCLKSGAVRFEHAAQLEIVPSESTGDAGLPAVRLSEEALLATGGFYGAESVQPDFIVDATGRSRLLPRALELPVRAGDRRDNALFAHCENVSIDNAGHVHTDRLDFGWCWRIPLGDRVSVGIVADPKELKQYGTRPEEQFDTALRSDSVLQRIAAGAVRTTPVLKFNNYQQTSEVGVGPNWALVGDSLGFIDPVFSSGLFLALDGARNLAAALAIGSPRALERYARKQRAHIDAWQKVVGYFYDARFFAMIRLRDQPQSNLISRALGPHLGRHLARVFTGESTAGSYDMRLLQLVMNHSLDALNDPDWRRWRIK